MESLEKPFKEKEPTVFDVIRDDHNRIKTMQKIQAEQGDQLNRMEEKMKAWQVAGGVFVMVAGIAGWVIHTAIEAYNKVKH